MEAHLYASEQEGTPRAPAAIGRPRRGAGSLQVSPGWEEEDDACGQREMLGAG